MATLREYYDSDHPVLRHYTEWTLTTPQGELRVVATIHYDFDTNAKYWSFYVPACSDPIRVCTSLLNQPHVGCILVHPAGR